MTRAPLSPAALARIYGHRLITASGYDRSAILRFARRWMRAEGASWGHAQKHAWAVARGQREKAQAFDAAPARPSIEWRMAA